MGLLILRFLFSKPFRSTNPYSNQAGLERRKSRDGCSLAPSKIEGRRHVAASLVVTLDFRLQRLQVGIGIPPSLGQNSLHMVMRIYQLWTEDILWSSAGADFGMQRNLSEGPDLGAVYNLLNQLPLKLLCIPKSATKVCMGHRLLERRTWRLLDTEVRSHSGALLNKDLEGTCICSQLAVLLLQYLQKIGDYIFRKRMGIPHWKSHNHSVIENSVNDEVCAGGFMQTTVARETFQLSNIRHCQS